MSGWDMEDRMDAERLEQAIVAEAVSARCGHAEEHLWSVAADLGELAGLRIPAAAGCHIPDQAATGAPRPQGQESAAVAGAPPAPGAAAAPRSGAAVRSSETLPENSLPPADACDTQGVGAHTARTPTGGNGQEARIAHCPNTIWPPNVCLAPHWPSCIMQQTRHACRCDLRGACIWLGRCGAQGRAPRSDAHTSGTPAGL